MDISSCSTGWAIFIDGGLVDHGLLKVESKKRSWASRLFTYAELIRELLENEEPDHVVIEDIYRGPSALTFKVLSFFHGVTYQLVKEVLDIDPEVIGVLVVRSLIGKESDVSCRTKEQAFFIMNNTLNLKMDFKKDNDIVDACALMYGYCYKNGLVPQKELSFDRDEYEKVVVKKAKKRKKKNGPVQSTRTKKKR